tara:strand:- start:1498 stop:1671 length:174 start_codon:yes stop_codon:yes gene_type:complete
LENPKCIVCGEEIYISHPVQRSQKKYCGYKCQAKNYRSNREKKRKVMEKQISSNNYA